MNLKNFAYTVNMGRVKEDISRFISDPEILSIWSPKYFHDLSTQLKLAEAYV